MAYDTESESSVAPIIVMILTLIVAPCAWMVVRCYQKDLTNPAETQEVQPTNELELGEASIVHNPLSAPTQVQLSERTLDLSSVTVLLTITYEDSYGKYHIKANGESQLSPENTRRRPTVSFNPRSGDVNYTLIMTNLDVLYSMEAICKEFIHWVVVNIPANGTVSDGDQICSYMGAAPYYNSGLQRYIFLLYSQEGNKLTRLQCQEAVQVFESRNVSLYGEWLQHLPSIYGANAAPVGFSAFRSSWTPYVDIVHETMMFMPPVPYRSPSQVSKTHAEAGRMQIEKWKTEFIGKKEEKTSDNERGDDRVYKSLHAAESEFGARIESISEQTSQAPANSDESTNSMQKRYGTEYESIFGGRILHKKTANEMKYKKRYCWIEAKEKKLCWSKEGIRKKHKSVSLDSDITAINLLRNRISFSHILGRKSSVDLEIYGSSEDNAEAARWYEVAMDIYYKGKG